jgi:hypothetical protein
VTPEAKDETRVTLVAAPSIDMQAVASTMGMLQGTSFPDVVLGTMR